VEVESREGREEGEGLGWHGTKLWVMRVSESGGLREEGEERVEGEEGEERGVRKGWIDDVDRFLMDFGVDQVQECTISRSASLQEGADLAFRIHYPHLNRTFLDGPFVIGSIASITLLTTKTLPNTPPPSTPAPDCPQNPAPQYHAR